MAVTNTHRDIQELNLRWPDLESLSPSALRFTYDRPTDTLFVDFHGEAMAAASIPLDRGDRDYLFLRVDPETEEVVGLQIEHFLSYAVMQHPELVGALDAATLTGINRHEVNQILPSQAGQRTSSDRPGVLECLRRLSA